MDTTSVRFSSINSGHAVAADARALGYLERSCPVRASIDVIGGRWKPSILELICKRPHRHGELKDAIDGISSQALSLQLRQLVADGVIERIGNDLSAYRLTVRGETLANVMDELAKWGTDYLRWRAGDSA